MVGGLLPILNCNLSFSLDIVYSHMHKSCPLSSNVSLLLWILVDVCIGLYIPAAGLTKSEEVKERTNSMPHDSWWFITLAYPLIQAQMRLKDFFFILQRLKSRQEDGGSLRLCGDRKKKTCHGGQHDANGLQACQKSKIHNWVQLSQTKVRL